MACVSGRLSGRRGNNEQESKKSMFELIWSNLSHFLQVRAQAIKGSRSSMREGGSSGCSAPLEQTRVRDTTQREYILNTKSADGAKRGRELRPENTSSNK